MHLNLIFPDWESYDRPIRSLINFFMKDAKAYFQANIHNNEISSYSCNIRSKYANFDYGDLRALNISYSSSEDETSSVASPHALPNIPCSLVQKNNTLKYRVTTRSYSEAYSLDPISNIRVTINPKIGNTINTNSNLEISDLSVSNPVIFQDINTIVGDYDFQLKTSEFYVESNLLSDNVHYRVGIVPLNKKYHYYNYTDVNESMSIDEIVSYLIAHESVTLSRVIDYIGYKMYGFTFCGYTYFENNEFEESCLISHDDSNHLDSLVVKSFISPIKIDSYIVGFAYFELYDSNNAAVSDEVVGTLTIYKDDAPITFSPEDDITLSFSGI